MAVIINIDPVKKQKRALRTSFFYDNQNSQVDNMLLQNFSQVRLKSENFISLVVNFIWYFGT